MCKGQSHHCSLSPHTLASASPATRNGFFQDQLSCTCSQVLGRALSCLRPLAPSRDFSLPGLALSCPQLGTRKGPCWRWLSCTYGLWLPHAPVASRAPTTPDTVPPPHPLLARAALGANSCGWPTHRGGAETTAEPQGHVQLRKKIWNLSLQMHRLRIDTPVTSLCKLSTYRTSEQTTSAPAAKTGLALAAVDFVGTYAWGLGQARVWAALKAPTVGPDPSDPWLLQSWDLTSVDLHWWTCENNIWETSGPIASIPAVKVGPRAVPTTV